MKRAIIFRFYKEVSVCKNRLKILKKYNPSLKIFWIYWWEKTQENLYKKNLSDYLDDFYTLESTDPHRKRINGDFALQERYKNRWKDLSRDSVYIVQRDILIFTSLEEYFSDYKENQIFLSWTTKLTKNIEKKRKRTSSKEEKPKYIKFKNHIKEVYKHQKDNILCCLPMFEILPRDFFNQYWTIAREAMWFIEYRKPTLAKILWFNFYQKNIWVHRFQNKKELPMNARSIEISEEYIKNELDNKEWRRIFHPYYKIWNDKK